MNSLPTTLGARNPYPGLRSFDTDEFEFFFGRDKQIDELLRRLRDHRFVAVLGLSGSGKSSLVRAGLIHKLRVGHLTTAGSQWHIALFRPGSTPIEALAAALDASLGILPDRARYLRTSTQELLRTTREGRSASENLLIVVDQFEETLRFQGDELSRERNAAHFVNLFLAVEQDLSPEYRVYVILTMRTDYLGECTQFEGLPEALNRSQYLVPRLTQEQTREAIEGPGSIVDTEIDSNLLQTLLTESAEGRDSLPLLQHMLMRLWERREPSPDGGSRLTLSTYHDLGGISMALNAYGNEVFAKLPPTHQELAEQVFKELTEVGQGRDQRRSARLSDLVRRTGSTLPDVMTVVEHFMAVNFLTSPDIGRLQDCEVDISHESLIRQWETLTTWANEEAKDQDDFLYFANRLKHGGDLLTGRDLDLAVKWCERKGHTRWGERYGDDFTDTLAFIERSRKAHLARRVALWGVTSVVLMILAVFLIYRYREYESHKYSTLLKAETADARQQGIRDGLEEGQAAARASARGLGYAIAGNFGAAQEMFKKVGSAHPTLPIETLDQAISDSQRTNNPAVTNLRVARKNYLAFLGLVTVAKDGHILHSDDGGGSWQALDLGTGIDLWSVAFTGPNRGWAVGENGTMLHTEDGGHSWHEQMTGTANELAAITFLDEHVGWTAGGRGTILRTMDGGRTWQKQSSGSDFWLGCLAFSSPQSGWVAGGGGVVLHTLDGGATWQKQNSPTKEVLRSITFVTSQSGWAVGYDGTILHTEDGGNSWQIQTSGTDAWLYGVTFISPRSGWIVGNKGTILHTDDAGHSWRMQNSGVDVELHGVLLISPLSGWIVGDKGTILYTDDGGDDWHKEDSHTEASLASITFVEQR
jgi:photosystem II stability/assembly factor-like uncharacterized protein